MVLDVKDIMDFLYCPMIQKYSSDNIESPFKNITEKYISDMKRFCSAYNLLLGENGINIEQAKTIFANLWLTTKTDNYIYIDSGDYRNNYDVLRKKGVESIIMYHENSKKNKYIPILFNYKYKVPLSKGLYLTGNIDLVRQVNGNIELVCYKPLSKLYRKENLINDIEIVAMLYAYEYMFSKKPDKVSVYIMDKGKYALVLNPNIELFKNSVISIAKIISNKLYYRANFDRCYKCIYWDSCNSRLN